MLRGLTGAVSLSLILTAGFAAAAGGETGDDPVGHWKLRCVSPDGKARECVVMVCREGRALKGTYAAEGVTRPAKGVAYDQGVLSVRVDGEVAGKAYGLTYTGKPRGDVLRG